LCQQTQVHTQWQSQPQPQALPSIATADSVAQITPKGLSCYEQPTVLFPPPAKAQHPQQVHCQGEQQQHHHQQHHPPHSQKRQEQLRQHLHQQQQHLHQQQQQKQEDLPPPNRAMTEALRQSKQQRLRQAEALLAQIQPGGNVSRSSAQSMESCQGLTQRPALSYPTNDALEARAPLPQLPQQPQQQEQEQKREQQPSSQHQYSAQHPRGSQGQSQSAEDTQPPNLLAYPPSYASHGNACFTDVPVGFASSGSTAGFMQPRGRAGPDTLQAGGWDCADDTMEPLGEQLLWIPV